MSNDIGGVWRTIGGRRVFIKDGDDLETAMRKSGKFKIAKKKKYTMKEIQEMADKEGVLPSEIQDRFGIKDKDLGLEPDNYTKEFEEQMQSVERYLKAEESKKEQAKSLFDKSINALNEIDRLAGNSEYLQKLGRQLGLKEFKEFLKRNAGYKKR